MRSPLPVSFLLSLAILAGTTAHAAVEKSSPTGFGDRILQRRGGVIAVAPIELGKMAGADPLRVRWSAFRARHGNGWSLHIDERSAMPALAVGPGLQLFPEQGFDRLSLDDVAERVLEFIADNDLMPGGAIELDRTAADGSRAGRWQLVFRQSADGVRVENSRMDVHVDRGRVTMFGTSNWAPLTERGLPRITADDARQYLDAYLGGEGTKLQPFGQPELVLTAIDADPTVDRPRKWSGAVGRGVAHALVWRLHYREPADPALWTAEIDAGSGAVRAFYDGAHYASVRGGVYPIAPEVGCTSGGCEIEQFPMPHTDWTESGQAAAVADAFGNLSCSDPAATFETSLAGPYARIKDNCGPLIETGSCSDGLDLGLKAGENCQVVPGASPGNTAAARSSYYHVNRVNEVARFYNPGLAWLDSSVEINSNWNQVCNASYGGGAIYLYRSGVSWADCANTGELETIVLHEWGHGLDFNDGGGPDNTSEAYGDIVAMLGSRQSCFGKGMLRGGQTCSGYGDACLTCTGFREHDWAARQANVPATPQDFVQNNCGTGSGPCGYAVHCESYPIDEAFFDFVTRDLPAAGMDIDSAWQLAERLWYSTRVGSGGDIYTCALPASDSCAASSMYQRMRSADDDDADLSNGTPHAAELYAAFARHNIACGAAGDPENQSTSSCPNLVRPDLTLDVSGPAPQLSWTPVPGADHYVVYRGELGCNHQKVPIETPAAGVTTWIDPLPDPGLARSYAVEAVGVNPACHSPVSNCETAGSGPRLQKNAHRVVEAGAQVNGSGLPDPGESVQVPVTLFNGGTIDALGTIGRLRTVDPAQGRVVEPVVDYADIAIGEALESPAPHFELTLFESTVPCGATVPLELEMQADNATTRTNRFELMLGETQRDFPNSGSLLIPRITQTPVTSTVTIDQDRTIAELDVTVDISHSNPPELIVDLTSPQGTTVRLHHLSGTPGGIYARYDLDTSPDGPGTMADFEGESALGVWTLAIQDTLFGGLSGSLQGFTLHVTVDGAFDCDILTCAEPAPAVAPAGLLVDRVVDGGDGSNDLVFSWTDLPGSAGYHVLQSRFATFDTEVDLIGRTGGASGLTVEGGAETPSDLLYFQVRAVNGCSEESP